MLFRSNRLEVLPKIDIQKIHAASIKILNKTGVMFHSAKARDIFRKHGTKVDGETVFIPQKIVEKAIETCPSSYRHMASNTSHSILVGFGQTKQIVTCQYGPVYIQDIENGRRLGTLQDYAKLIKLNHASDSVNVVGGIPVDPSDAKPDSKHLQMLYLTIKHTDKALMGLAGNRKQVRETLDMVEIAMGRSTIWDSPVIAVPVCPLSPLKYASEPTDTIIAYAQKRQPIYINSCVLAGVSGPISLAGTATLMNAEILAGVVLAQLIHPGTPVVYVPGATVANMKTGGYITGSPEANLINVTGLQLALNLYRMPTRVMSGLSDAKTLDYQSGAETMQNIFMPLLAGAHILNNTLGSLDSLMTTSYEKFILDEESIQRVLRVMEGINGFDLDISLDLIQELAHSGQYLIHANTLENFKLRWRPTISNWDSYDDWEKSGAPDIAVKANRKFKQILRNAPDSLLDKEVDHALQFYMKSLE
jgi:trimethylamine--corrinoid protein Co-methyltransferase